jgi:hypothetical protein
VCVCLHRAGGPDGVDEAELVEDVGAAHHRDHHLDVVREERRLDAALTERWQSPFGSGERLDNVAMRAIARCVCRLP